jgi:bleomycin hydrolase
LKQSKKEYTPQELYLNEIKPISGNDVHRKVVLINVPHLQENQYYTVKELNNMEGGIMIYYFNVNAKTMKHYVIQQLFDNKCVWFGCDYDKFNYKEESLLNNTLFSYDKFLLKKKDLILPKSNALPFYQTSVNHAMSFTGFYHRPTARKTPLYWNVENSHSTKMNEISFQDSHGHLIMSDSWFDSFVVISAVDEMYFKNDTLASKIRDKDNVIELPKWSYLGELLLH